MFTFSMNSPAVFLEERVLLRGVGLNMLFGWYSVAAGALSAVRDQRTFQRPIQLGARKKPRWKDLFLACCANYVLPVTETV